MGSQGWAGFGSAGSRRGGEAQGQARRAPCAIYTCATDVGHASLTIYNFVHLQCVSLATVPPPIWTHEETF
jgi:hypothetical protein